MIPLTLTQADHLALTLADGDFSFVSPDPRGGILPGRTRQLTYLKAAYRTTFPWLYPSRVSAVTPTGPAAGPAGAP